MNLKKGPAAGYNLRPASLITGLSSPVFFNPNETLPVSVSGEKCSLDCAHCQGHFLKTMTPLIEAGGKNPDKIKSFLVSGGCDREGRVYLPAEEDLPNLASKGRLNFHVTLIDDEQLTQIIPWAHTVSQDLHGDDRVIREVLGLEKSFTDYWASYKRVWSRARVIPHILIGLGGEKFKGEKRVVKLLENYPPPAVIFLVYLPLVKSPLIPKKPPSLNKVIDFLGWARLRLEGIPLVMGCMRPGGKYRLELDKQVLNLGFSGLVQPSCSAQSPILSKECCALWDW